MERCPFTSVLKNDVEKKFENFSGKHQCWLEFLFDNVASVHICFDKMASKILVNERQISVPEKVIKDHI